MTSSHLHVHLRRLQEHHVDEGDEEVGGAVLTEWVRVICTIINPLDEDHEDKVSKDAEKEDQLWQELKEDVAVLSLTDFVPEAQHDTKRHVDDSKDQRYFHFVGV